MVLHDVWNLELPIGMTSRAGARPCFVVPHDCSIRHRKPRALFGLLRTARLVRPQGFANPGISVAETKATGCIFIPCSGTDMPKPATSRDSSRAGPV